ncbi:hypothetical protein DH2020_006181 [Rehmannia glutinosa]|uniref:Uncharacterized protein n=1 Tax=Rehmannia glutinosa TaxID=99300 RepID=A0ABR0XI55_REHGL
MKNVQDQQNSLDIKPNIVSHDSQTEQQNNATETPIPDSGSVSVSSNDNRKVSREDIELVQNLIERCLQLYMNKDEVVKTLLNRARIDPGFTTLGRASVSSNEISRAPKGSSSSHAEWNTSNACAVNNLPMGYPVIQHPPLPATGQPHMDPMAYSTSTCHIVNGVPAPANFHPMRMNSGNEMVIEHTTADVSPILHPNNAMSSMSDMPVSPTSVASSGHFPFSASEISGIGVDTSALDTAFTSDVASSVGLQLPPDNGAGNSRDSLRSLAQIPWNFSLSDLTADLSNLGDLGALGNYPGSPFLPSDSDILLDSPEQEDIVEEFFVDSDSVPGQCPPSDEEKS